eukprot:1270226-Amphidinium_carterae.1
MSKVKGKFNFTYLRGQACRPLKKHFRAKQDPPPPEVHPETVDFSALVAEPLDVSSVAEPRGVG